MSEQLTGELRFIDREDKKILQQRFQKLWWNDYGVEESGGYFWRDVPFVVDHAENSVEIKCP